MATGIIDNFEDFIEVVKRFGDPNRYELWFTEDLIALIPTVTSKNVHTYFVRYSTKEQLETIIGGKEKEGLFKGRILRMSDILLDKW